MHTHFMNERDFNADARPNHLNPKNYDEGERYYKEYSETDRNVKQK